MVVVNVMVENCFSDFEKVGVFVSRPKAQLVFV